MHGAHVYSLKVANIFFEDRCGGPHKRAIMVGRELMANGVSTIMVLPAGCGNAEEEASREGIRTVRIPFCRTPRLSKPGRLLRWLLMLPFDVYRFMRFFRLELPDAVHVNGAFFLAPAMAACIARIPLVWHLNDTIVPPKVALVLGKLVLWMSDEIIVAARAVAAHYAIPDGRYTVIYAPVDVRKVHVKRMDGNQSDTLHIGLLANWSPIKGVEYYVQAAAELRCMMQRPLQVLFAGQRMSDIGYCEGVDRLIDESGLRPCVVDLGFVGDVGDFLERLDILVMSSTTEACPMSVLEAMAKGIPVVATDVGGARELLLESDEEAGIIVPAMDASAIAAALMGIQQSQGLAKRMGSAGRRLAEKRFSLDACAAEHHRIYLRACAYQMEAE